MSDTRQQQFSKLSLLPNMFNQGAPLQNIMPGGAPRPMLNTMIDTRPQPQAPPQVGTQPNLQQMLGQAQQLGQQYGPPAPNPNLMFSNTPGGFAQRHPTASSIIESAVIGAAGAGASPRGILGGMQGLNRLIELRRQKHTEIAGVRGQQIQAGMNIQDWMEGIQSGQREEARANLELKQDQQRIDNALADNLSSAAYRTEMAAARTLQEETRALAETRLADAPSKTPDFEPYAYTDPNGKTVTTEAHLVPGRVAGTFDLQDRSGLLLPPDAQRTTVPPSPSPQRAEEHRLRKERLELDQRLATIREEELRTGKPLQPAQARGLRNDIYAHAEAAQYEEANTGKSLKDIVNELLGPTGLTDDELLRLAAKVGETPQARTSAAGPPRLIELSDADKLEQAEVGEKFPLSNGVWKIKLGPDTFEPTSPEYE